MTKKSAEFIFQPGIIGRFLGAGPLKTCCSRQCQYNIFFRKDINPEDLT